MVMGVAFGVVVALLMFLVFIQVEMQRCRWSVQWWPRWPRRKKPWVPRMEHDLTARSWGNSIVFRRSDRGVHEIGGWCPNIVRVGDCLLSRFRRADGSEYVGHLFVQKVEYPGNPSDMFFATVVNYGESHDGVTV